MNKKIVDVRNVRSLYWNKGLTVKEISKKLDISVWALYDFMSRNNIQRRSYAEANYLVHKDKPRFQIKKNLSRIECELKIAGIMLYWAEGTFKGSTVDFANSNPEMIKIFLAFLRHICGVKEERFRVYLYAHSHSDVEKLKAYWHDITKIPLSQFTKPYIRQGNPNLSNRKLPCGTIHIRYNDKRLLIEIRQWIDDYVGRNRGEVP